MIDFSQPRARDWAGPLFVCVLTFVWASTLKPTSWTMAIYGVSLVFGLWFLVNALHHVMMIFGALYREKRDVDFQFSQNYLVDRISKMTPEQLKAVRAGMNTIEVLPGERGPIYKVGGCNCYLYTAWFILINSNDDHVMPVNRFMTGTYHYDVRGDMTMDDHQQAKNFHHWLYMNGFAMWGSGNTSMSWNPGWGPDKVLMELGLERDEYED